MNRPFATIVLFITAATYVGFALWLSLTPDALLTTFGVNESTPEMRTEIRAFYGGIETGIAIVMLVLWKRGDIVAGLLIGGVPLLCSATGRCVGMFAEGFSQTHAMSAGFEAVGFLFCMAGIVSIRRNDAANSE